MQRRPKFELHGYAPCNCCGAHCDLGGQSTKEQPCWGRVLHWEYDGYRCLGHDVIGKYQKSRSFEVGGGVPLARSRNEQAGRLSPVPVESVSIPISKKPGRASVAHLNHLGPARVGRL